MWHNEKIDIIVWEDNKAWSVVAKFLEKSSTEIKWRQRGKVTCLINLELSEKMLTIGKQTMFNPEKKKIIRLGENGNSQSVSLKWLN